MGQADMYVEYRSDGETVVLAHLSHADGFPHHTTLIPFVASLHLAGQHRGELCLIEANTGRVIARRRLDQPLRRRVPPKSH